MIRFIPPPTAATVWQWGLDDGDDLAIGDDTRLYPDYVSDSEVYLAAAFFGFMFSKEGK